MSAVPKIRTDEVEAWQPTSAPEIADALMERYGDEAPLQAALSARGAIESGDVEACMVWRDVIDLLCARIMPSDRSH
jgi:hypothetical protein